MSLRRVVFSALAVLAACSIVGESGRARIAWFPSTYMNELGASSYDGETTAKFKLISSGKDYEMVQRVGRKIADASGANYAWEFRLLDAPDVVNAFCLPGGKVAVYSGLLKVTQNEAALAAVVGHEVAHATAEHGNERMTQQMIATGVMAATELALDGWSDMAATERATWMEALGVGANFVVLLPFSRTHESEADEIGIRDVVRAGYDPDEAPKLWDRMAAASPDRQPEFMSTHPDPANRAARLRERIPAIVAEESSKAPKRQVR